MTSTYNPLKATIFIGTTRKNPSTNPNQPCRYGKLTKISLQERMERSKSQNRKDGEIHFNEQTSSEYFKNVPKSIRRNIIRKNTFFYYDILGLMTS